mgnify:CR=1
MANWRNLKVKIMAADLVGTAEKVGEVITVFLFGDNRNCKPCLYIKNQ